MEKTVRIASTLYSALAIASFLSQAPALAQERTVTPSLIDTATLRVRKGFLDQLAEQYQAGAWQQLRGTLIETLCNGQKERAPTGICNSFFAKEDAFDPIRNYYSVVFVAAGTRQEPQVLRFLLHVASDRDENPTRLPGLSDAKLGALRELVLTDSPDTVDYATYAFAKLESTQSGQAPEILKQIAIAGLAVPLFAPPPAATEEMESIYARLSSVMAPYSRATITIQDVFTIPPEPVAPKLATKAAEQRTFTLAREATDNACIQTLANNLAAAITAQKCTALAQCRAQHPFSCTIERTSCWSQLQGDEEAALRSSLATPSCTGLTTDQLGLALQIEARFRSIVTPADDKERTGTTKYSNIPLTRFSFGATTSLMTLVRQDRTRAKVDSGKLSQDPLTGTMTMGIVNIHPKAYDTEVPSMTARERLRFYVGGVLTPTFGFGGGLSIGLLRGLSINVGESFLFIQKLRDGDAFDAAPTNPEHPLRLGMARAASIGVGYNFK